MSRAQRIEDWCQKVWDQEQAKMQLGLDYPESHVRVATVHTLKQALQIPVGLGAIYGCLRTIRITLMIIAVLLAAITFRLYAQ
jgi:hypothetical protein